jgi:phosphoribosylamine--glycine ligase
VVIEECLVGEEASFIVMVDGRDVVPMATSQDHKRLLDNDQGPNTGGMGAYSPAPVVTQAVFDTTMRDIIWPTVQGMAKDGITFTGFLYAGLMIAPDGTVKTLEFNCRMGDPETQPILMRLKSDLGLVLLAGAKGEFSGLSSLTLEWDERVALGVVLAAHGYPAQPRKGDAVQGLPADGSDCVVFHAGTALNGEQLLSSGGRVLCVSALATSVESAQQVAYAAIAQIKLPGSQYRSDIGARAVA